MLTRLLLITCLSLWTKFCVAEVSFKLSETLFNFNASTIHELTEKVKESGPKLGKKSVWAILKWDLYTEYHLRNVDGRCQIKLDSIEVVADVALPDWQNVKDNQSHVINWWNNYLAFIKQHEQAHFDNVYLAAQQFELSLQALASSETCNIAKSLFLRTKQDFLQNVKARDKRLDQNAKKLFFSNKELFLPLKDGLSVSFESGLMNSYISL